MDHFANQLEGTADFYDFVEHYYRSEKFNQLALEDFISLGYNFYKVHAGSNGFFKQYSGEIMSKISESTSTYDLLRVL